MRLETILVAATLVVAGCGPASDANPPSSDTQTAGQTASGGDPYRAAVAHPDRPAGDLDRDAARKPAAVLEFFAIAPGMRVLDLYSGGGYYSELLARVVGPEGVVSAHNNRAYLAFAGDEIESRYAGNRLPNIVSLMAENNELALDPDSYDAITMILTYHDFYYADPDNGWPLIDGPKLLAELFKALKPGGTVGLIDHGAAAGSPADTGGTLHRIDPGIVIREMQAAGFELDGQSDMLRNPDDDHRKSVFDPAIRGKSDRFVLRFTKPR